MSEIVKDCLVTRLKGAVSGNLPKLGEYELDLVNMVAGGIYQMRFDNRDTNTITLSDNAYFCQDANDDTPINGTAAESRSITLSNTTNVYLKLVSGDSATLAISDKYSFSGIGRISGNPVYYDVPFEELVHMPKWTRFAAGSLKDLAAYPITELSSAYNCFCGDVSNTTIKYKHLGAVRLGQNSRGLTGDLVIDDVEGVYMLDITLLNTDVSCDITSLTNLPHNGIVIASNNVYGVLNTPVQRVMVVTYGDQWRYSIDRSANVTIANDLSLFPATDKFSLFSNSVTVGMLETLIGTLLAYSNEAVFTFKEFILKSSEIDENNLDSTLVTNINTIVGRMTASDKVFVINNRDFAGVN